MWSHDDAFSVGRMIRPALALALAGLLAGCFQPLYTQQTLGGGRVHAAMRSIDVEQINAARGSPQARVAVALRDALLFDLDGGESRLPPTHRLKIEMKTTRSALIVDISTGQTEVELTGIDVNYTLTELATGKVVVNGQGFSRVSTDIPGEEQRFALLRGERDAENRAAKTVADQITARLQSYLVAGT
jgi:LPS-assembly lipoprotein